MKLAPPILILSTTTAFIPPARQGIYHGMSYEQSPLQNVEDSTDNTPLPGVEEEYAFNIGEMPRSLNGSVKKRQMAKDALQKLLERQQRDVQQTLDLIQNLDLEKNISHYEEEDRRNTRSEAPSIALSIASGADYGYLSRSEGCRPSASSLEATDIRFEGYGPPGNLLSIGSQQFMRNCRAMINEYSDEEDVTLTPRQRELQSKLSELTLNSSAIWEREHARGPLVAPLIIKIPYLVLCYLLDIVFEGRNPFSRFFLLETVARMPYFSYITMLHLYETFGFWRRSSDVKRIHFAEEWNEFHHLLIMESLGGDQPYWVRFMAQHSALAYYIALCALWALSPTLSYKFSEMLETHAVDTYGQFVDENADKLRKLPPSIAAVEYYTIGVSDPLFGEYQTASVNNPSGVRRPGLEMKTLYDVFVAIRNDEGDHVSTMNSCLDPKEVTLSPALESRVLTGVALASTAGYFLGDTVTIDSLASTINQISSGIGLQGLEGLADMADTAPDLDAVIESGGNDISFINGIVGGLAGMVNGIKEVTGMDPELDEDAADIAGSALEDVAAGGLDGFEMEGLVEVLRNIAVGILEIIGFL